MYFLLNPKYWKEYELIDSGDGEKLERFGKYTLIRPEPQALWPKKLSKEAWTRQASAKYTRFKSRNNIVLNTEKGEWKVFGNMPESWKMRYTSPNLNLTFRLARTSFGHIGIFPEQSENWEFIYESIKAQQIEQPRVLNLFAYTGGASLAAASAGATVTHLDSIRQTVTWANQNASLNTSLSPIKWIVEDAMKYVQREVRRGNTYHGIILDPPAYGRGPKGEKWHLDEQINDLVANCAQLLEPKGFFLINIYSMGHSALILDNLVKAHFGKVKSQYGEIHLSSSSEQHLPLGTYLRFIK